MQLETEEYMMIERVNAVRERAGKLRRRGIIIPFKGNSSRAAKWSPFGFKCIQSCISLWK